MTYTRQYTVDNAHSEIEFKVKWLGVSTVTGYFLKFNTSGSHSSEIQSELENLENSELDIVIDVDSIDTGNEIRDTHLKSSDFFDSESIPYITFAKNSMIKNSENSYKIIGNLIMYGVMKEIEFDLQIIDVDRINIVSDSYPDAPTKFWILNTKINRSDFNLVNYSPGGISHDYLISDEIEITARFQVKIIDFQY